MRIRIPAALAFSALAARRRRRRCQAQVQEDSAADLTARVETAAEVLRQIQSVPEEQIPAELFRGGRAVAIFPKVIKVGLLVGGRFGQGVLSVRSEDGGWSSPVFMELAG